MGLTAKEKMKRYREKLKSNQEKLEKDRERKKLAFCTVEQKK